MICDPAANNINVDGYGGPGLPGLGLPFSVPKIPFPDVSLPEGIPEAILDLIERIFALFPQGIKFVPNADALTKGIWDVLASLFNQLAPFLAFYKFIQALLNIILCIIDVLCALMTPRATLRAVRRLFSRCLPDFLSLFPWLALLIMILALILLLIALIEYIIQIILAYIRQILRNLDILARSIYVHDEESILAAINKLAYLLCLIEQLFAIFLAIAALFAIIQPLMGILGRTVCGPNDACCTEDFCPDFIRGAPESGRASGTGQLIYFNRIEPELPSDPVFSFLGNITLPAIREDRKQFIDTDAADWQFADIITPSPEFGLTYWPEGESYDSNANTVRVPYLLDMNLELDPAEFGNSSDTGGYRKFSVQDIIVQQRPTFNAVSYNNDEYDIDDSGALVLVGGKVFEVDENDGYTAYNIGNTQATLDTLIRRETTYRDDIPTQDDGYYFMDVEYNFRTNHEVLWQKTLIGTMCQPDTALESAVTDAEFNDKRSVFEKVGPLPDIGTLDPDHKDGTGCLGCMARSLTKFRKNITEDTTNTFGEEMTECLENLKKEAEDFYCRGAGEAADRFTSDFELDPDIQFIKREIVVTVRLRDKTGTQLAVNVPQSLGECLADILSAEATFGEISDFEYDGYGDFVASLTSEEAGRGQLTATLKGELFATVINRDNDDVRSEIITRVLPYEFIDRATAYREDETRQRFGPPDIAEDGE